MLQTSSYRARVFAVLCVVLAGCMLAACDPIEELNAREENLEAEQDRNGDGPPDGTPEGEGVSPGGVGPEDLPEGDADGEDSGDPSPADTDADGEDSGDPSPTDTDTDTDPNPDTDPAPASRDIYRGFFCDSGLFIETYDIGEEDALSNCLLNDASNPGLGVICTWNDEVIYDSCETVEVPPSAESCDGWEAATLDRVPEYIDTTYQSADVMNCDGPSFVRFDEQYALWVGLVSCGTGYRFYLADNKEGPFLPAADGGGHGQDLCELVDPTFSIPNDDDITSGGCADCSIGSNYSFIAGELYLRYTLGQQFTRTEALSWGAYQSSVINCGAGPLECTAITTPTL